jgi:putative tricarboxylic transport membrane protein
MQEVFQHLLDGLSLGTIAFIMLGVFAGIIVGAIPGLTASMLIALTLPFTFSMNAIDAISMLVAMYVGGVSGSLITAILLRVPGTPSAVITTLDGYPMTQKGQPGRALGLGIAASFVGGIISWVFLVILAKPLSHIAVRLSEFDIFSMIVVALALLIVLSKGNMIKGLIAGVLGLLISLPGIDPIGGNYRFTFGLDGLRSGFSLLPVLVGLFAGSRILKEILGGAEETGHSKTTDQSLDGMFLGMADYTRHGFNMLRSSVIGTWIGILPGVGANVGSAFAYAVSKSFSKEAHKYGSGSEEGVIASEAGNNATVGGALVPLIALGIPGSVVDAILIGGLIIHGLQPGPNLFASNPQFVYSILAATLIANIFMFAFMTGTVRYIAKIALVPKAYLLPPIVVMCITGSFLLSNSWFDVGTMIFFSFIGFMLEEKNYPLAPMVIGFVLGPIAEASFRSALMYTDGAFLPLALAPFPIGCMLVAVGMIYLMQKVEGRQNAKS